MSQNAFLVLKLVDILSITISGIIAYIAYFGFEGWAIATHYHLAIILGVLLSLIIFPWFSIDMRYRQSIFPSVPKLMIAWLTVIAVLIIIAFTLKVSVYFSRVWIVNWTVLGGAMLLVMRVIVHHSLYYIITKRVWHLNKIVVIGAQALGQKLVQNIKASEPYVSVKVVAFFDDDDKLQDKTVENIPVKRNIKALLTFVKENEIDEVWVTPHSIEPSQLETILHQLRLELVTLRFVANLLSFRLINASITNKYALPVITISESPMSQGINRVLKAIEDRVLASLILLLISPLMLVIVEKESGPVWAKKDENRATCFGGFLRKTSLDELPQFWNVLKGDMSIVGPRPERPVFVEQFKHEIPDYMQKHLVKGGITGWAQVNGWRGDTDLRQRIEHDIFYIENWSVRFDLQIIVMTIFKVIFDKNAC